MANRPLAIGSRLYMRLLSHPGSWKTDVPNRTSSTSDKPGHALNLLCTWLCYSGLLAANFRNPTQTSLGKKQTDRQKTRQFSAHVIKKPRGLMASGRAGSRCFSRAASICTQLDPWPLLRSGKGHILKAELSPETCTDGPRELSLAVSWRALIG